MKFIRTAIPDVVIIEPTVFGDDRGYFVETFRQDKLDEFLGFRCWSIKRFALSIGAGLTNQTGAGN